VQCLLFMVALSGYDQCLVEDQNAVSGGHYNSLPGKHHLTVLSHRTKCTRL
jgi:hypothetical protein